FVAWYLRAKLLEPEIFVKKQTALVRQKTSRLEPFRLLIKDKSTAKIRAGIGVLPSEQNFGYYGIRIWMPNFLSKQLGFRLTKSGVWTAVPICGMMFGIWLFVQLADRIGMNQVCLRSQFGSFLRL
ncbi:MFS transporter, partial [Pasteurella multocida]|nr:MFS transporter [Pasteurella multocida]